ncbi:2,3-bisphosphoglycerate-independent phosphoglycerate mutase [Hymenobacter lutimineralis]|uniref:2,3-bisphosphoglycerate-independent phosphoglycerate mutase n=1 Tax=Hymenobacter lutimineralis TaxID=2606448 RepID=A0A5D6V167_9BACT|nr:2,3-bisphosphoglycerate-independent phosphoglycerate mutase [Hymenobacter lutimineralis]TYZ09210.1 2,3-bisphosphoglycerate-independent phosphoglycerate mutase [Hymenobacter lutimineralis]
MNKQVLLVILDGWGLGTNPEVSAIAKAHTPYVDSLFQRFSHSKLQASGEAVGLPDGQMGNSEVGHMNIGAGRVVYQDLVRINKSIRERKLGSMPALTKAFDYARTNGKNVHYIGLLSDGGVHSHIEHLKALCTLAHDADVHNVFIHAFTDGRDTDPKGGVSYVNDLEQHLQRGASGKIASIVGRYYAMDRDNRWERVKEAYDLLVNGKGTPSQNLIQSMLDSYKAGLTDEFMKPIVKVGADGLPLATIQEGDVVLCFNFRTDRGREITQALTQQDFHAFNMHRLNLHYLTMTNYDATFVGVTPIFEKDNLDQTLGEVLAANGKKQIRMAETEKYPHVTFFFSGGREVEFEGETRIMRASPKVATYDLQPEMSAYELRDALVPELQAKSADFVVLNFANPDMVGHTGVFEAAVKAVETVDACTRDVVETALASNYACIIIADHGNADMMVNPDGTPNTAHTTNLVPCILADNDYRGKLNDGKLGDIAPTVLQLMGLPQPQEMGGVSLLQPQTSPNA